MNPTEIARLDWEAARPFASALLVLQLLDIVMGLICAFCLKTLSSSASWRGMSRKAGTLIIVAVAVVVDPFVPDLLLGKWVALFYIVTEALSLIENAGRLGIPVPIFMLEALAKLRDTETAAKPVPRTDQVKP